VPAETRSKISTSPDTFVYTIAELIRKVGISEQTFYRWKSKYVGLEVDRIRQLKQLSRCTQNAGIASMRLFFGT
jgi:hypothetical protein